MSSACNTLVIIDQSSSIGGNNNIIEAAVKSIIDSLEPLNGGIAINNFSSESPAAGRLNSISDPAATLNGGYFLTGSEASLAKTFLENQLAAFPSGSTDWQAAFVAAALVTPPPDTIIFFTDGAPNPGEDGFTEAQAFRDAGTRIISVGVTSAVTSPGPLANLINLTSNSEGNTNGPQEGVDYFIAESFELIETLAAGIITQGFGCIESPSFGANINFSICGCSKHNSYGKYKRTSSHVGGSQLNILQTIVNMLSEIIAWRIQPSEYIPPTVSPSIMNVYFYDQSQTLDPAFVKQVTLNVFLKIGETDEVTDESHIKAITYIINNHYNNISSWLANFYNLPAGDSCASSNNNKTSIYGETCISCLELTY